MRIRKIIGMVFILLGLSVLIVFSRETPGIIASTVLVVVGLVLTFMNRQGKI